MIRGYEGADVQGRKLRWELETYTTSPTDDTPLPDVDVRRFRWRATDGQLDDQEGLTVPLEILTRLVDQATGASREEREAERNGAEYMRALEVGMTEDEAIAWVQLGQAAGRIVRLPILHGADAPEWVNLIHRLQDALLARPTYRAYLDKERRANGDSGNRTDG